MRALVVFESMFGNTELVARAVADGLRSVLPTEVVEVGAAPPGPGEGVGLLVVGGPTHAFGMSRSGTREDAARQAAAPVVSARIGLREWLAGLTPARGVAAAAFDTHIDKPRVPGSAARAADRRLRRLGFDQAAPPESFFVRETSGPLVAGELERARRWGEQIAASVPATRPPTRQGPVRRPADASR